MRNKRKGQECPRDKLGRQDVYPTIFIPQSQSSTMSEKLTIQLSHPKPASDDCLPHAAMALGSIRGVGTRPAPTLVHRLVIQEQLGSWVMYRLDGEGGFVGDTWHPTCEDALKQVKMEFGIDSPLPSANP